MWYHAIVVQSWFYTCRHRTIARGTNLMARNALPNVGSYLRVHTEDLV